MQFSLVLQWPAGAIGDYDAMIELEEDLIRQLPSGSTVDGHDAGSGEINIFVLTESPAETFDAAKRVVAARNMMGDLRAGFRRLDGTAYAVLWPPALTSFIVR